MTLSSSETNPTQETSQKLEPFPLPENFEASDGYNLLVQEVTKNRLQVERSLTDSEETFESLMAYLATQYQACFAAQLGYEKAIERNEEQIRSAGGSLPYLIFHETVVHAFGRVTSPFQIKSLDVVFDPHTSEEEKIKAQNEEKQQINKAGLFGKCLSTLIQRTYGHIGYMDFILKGSSSLS